MKPLLTGVNLIEYIHPGRASAYGDVILTLKNMRDLPARDTLNLYSGAAAVLGMTLQFPGPIDGLCSAI